MEMRLLETEAANFVLQNQLLSFWHKHGIHGINVVFLEQAQCKTAEIMKPTADFAQLTEATYFVLQNQLLSSLHNHSILRENTTG